MIILFIFAMAALVFLSRYLFLEPRLPLRLNPTLHRLLSYSGPAVLTAIWAPIVFTDQGTLWVSHHNPYLWAALLAVILAWKSSNVLLTTLISMAMFLLLNIVLLS
ncbi:MULTISPECIES: AzlD domain-containing protein [unclassified Vibrio]|uniref:AzlD domain-containing protein n=1 Tax=unclassified Vibrio TaxID=2614977 RepID=UPI001482A4F1|nr:MULTISPECIES: AzlD domain-containing protein [unclassified Vibrio]NNN44966.1 AzlD domain-containing protein [Vibrio sp. 1-1(7)]NNN72339.1 AzlD domain-containing protein [Vibrio sp. 12-2(3-a)]